MNLAEVGFFAVVGAMPVGLIAAAVLYWWLGRDTEKKRPNGDASSPDKRPSSPTPNPFRDPN